MRGPDDWMEFALPIDQTAAPGICRPPILVRLPITRKQWLQSREAMAPAPTEAERRWCAHLADHDGRLGAYLTRDDCRTTGVRVRLTFPDLFPRTAGEILRILGAPTSIRRLGSQQFGEQKTYSLVYDGKRARKVLDWLGPYLQDKKGEYLVWDELWVAGQLGQRRGPRGFAPQVDAIRKKLVAKLKVLQKQGRDLRRRK